MIKRQFNRQISLVDQYDKESDPKNVQYILEILQKDPKDRNQCDLSILLDFTRDINLNFYMNNQKSQDQIDILKRECCLQMQFKTVKKGQYVFEQGDVGDFFYIIISGKVAVYVKYNIDNMCLFKISDNNHKYSKILKNTKFSHMILPKSNCEKFDLNNGKQTLKGILGPGQYFGEQALIYNSARKASIKCLTDCYFSTLNKAQYDKILKLDQENDYKVHMMNIIIFNQLLQVVFIEIY